ncbi:MAG: 50S ribosomal protein L11 methyltransferase [Thermodesulfobacteriota bacterium]|nr:50S ribosomal protein L11 methyltransferase [Thermodesulfobacteriota bacterium]
MMKWIEVKVIFACPAKELATDLISNIFYELGLKGVVVGDPDIKPAEQRGNKDKISPGDISVTGYIPEDKQSQKHLKIIKEKLSALEKEWGILSKSICRTIDEQDWSESWKEFFHPLKITQKIVIKPSWQDYDANPDDLIIEIDPGMAFGTGTHPTTALCISMIEKYIKQGDTFLDIGTGSGILMIVAAKLGARKVCGIDNDELAIDIAEKNLILNGIENKHFKLMPGTLTDNVTERFDFVAANILTETILILLESIKRVLKKRSVFICSGIIEKNKDKVIKKMVASGFKIKEIVKREEWVSIVGVLQMIRL